MPQIAGPIASSDAIALASGRNRASPRGGGAIWRLRLLFVGLTIGPILLSAVGGYLSYRASYERAAVGLAEAASVAQENTAKIIDTHSLVAARIDDLLSGSSDAEIRSQEKLLHESIAQQIEDFPQVSAAWVIDGNGHELVSARVYPVDRDLDHSGRDDYRTLQEPRILTLIRALRARSLDRGDYQPYFTVSRRRRAPDGEFRGIVVVAVSGSYFASFYNPLVDGSAQYTVSVLREDGANLARYPETAAFSSPGEPNHLLRRAIADKATSGLVATGSPLRGDGSLVAYKRIANYPVYVTVAQTRASMLHVWLESIIGYVITGVPAAIGLMLLSLFALRRTRREQLAVARARDATAQRADLEAHLHQMQGLLTGGIAHDFNAALAGISANIESLQSDLEFLEARRRKWIASAIGGCKRASVIARRLLTFARREPVDPQPIDVTKAVTRLSELPWRSMTDHIAIKFRLSGELWPVFVDPQQLETALLNLAFNARDAMDGRGSLTIETTNCHLGEDYAARHPEVSPGDYVAIFVSDTGRGMPQEVRDKAFHPLFTTKEAGKGSGLGLSQVYGFITRSGGDCIIDSKPGHGTTVKLYLPRYFGVQEDADSRTGNGAQEGGHRDFPVAAGGEASRGAKSNEMDRLLGQLADYVHDSSGK